MAPTVGPAALQPGRRLRLQATDRLLWVWLSRLWTGWRSAPIRDRTTAERTVRQSCVLEKLQERPSIGSLEFDITPSQETLITVARRGLGVSFAPEPCTVRAW